MRSEPKSGMKRPSLHLLTVQCQEQGKGDRANSSEGREPFCREKLTPGDYMATHRQNRIREPGTLLTQFLVIFGGCATLVLFEKGHTLSCIGQCLREKPPVVLPRKVAILSW